MQVNPKNTGHQNTKECQVGVEWKQQRETAVTSALASPWGSIGTGGGNVHQICNGGVFQECSPGPQSVKSRAICSTAIVETW